VIETELYDMATDIAERRNLASANPEVVARLSALLFGWLKSGPE
jgi:hypothetical protein